MKPTLTLMCLLTTFAIPCVRATAQDPTLAGAGFAVLSGVLSYEGAEAWKRFRHIPNEQELHSESVRTLAAAIGERLDQQRLGQAQSHFLNAVREIQYYLNNPSERKNSLEEARTQSGYALNELQQMGAQGLDLYSLCAILHMAVLQEQLKASSNPEGEQRNIALHTTNTREYVNAAKNKIIASCKWDPNTLRRKPSAIVVPGTLAIDIPDAREDRARQGVVDTQLVALAFEKPSEAFPILQQRIEAQKKANKIDPVLLQNLPSAPVSTGSLQIQLPK